MLVVGLMSGTSVDAIEAAAADFDVEQDAVVLRPRGHLTVPYDGRLRQQILSALPPAPVSMEMVARLDSEIGIAFAGAAEQAMAAFTEGRADLVVSHGQTVFHWVEDGRARGTLQLGAPAWIAERTGVAVLSDVRARDIAAGGQGAPLVSLFDAMLLAGGPPRAALNLGGIANLTVVGGGTVVAFDVGPANAWLDAWIQSATEGAETMDAGGRRAARGTVDEELLERLLADPYYRRPPPKSTGREHFSLERLRAEVTRHGAAPALDSMLATLSTLTARTVAAECRRFQVSEVLASGGGTRNPTLMGLLTEAAGSIPVRSIEDFGIPSLAKEAYAFALIGFMTANGWPATVPSATGAARASLLGSLTPGRDPWRPPLAAPGPAPARLVVR